MFSIGMNLCRNYYESYLNSMSKNYYLSDVFSFFFFSFLLTRSSELANRQILVKNYYSYYLKYNCASCSRDHVRGYE